MPDIKPTKIAHTTKPARVAPCTCSHPYQDQRYGVGMRVQNPCSKHDGKAYTCTVCGTIHEK